MSPRPPAGGFPDGIRPTTRMVDTPHGPARVVELVPSAALRRGTLFLGHGAGGRDWSADLIALAGLAAHGWSVVLVEQPWRVAGRSVAGPPATLDAAWRAVLDDARRRRGRLPRPWVLGGRSAGARVACRTASSYDAAGVLALSFPLHPSARPERSRADELAAPGEHGIPVLVVQGDRDPFGLPAEFAPAPGRELRAVPGTHTLDRAAPTLVDLVLPWLGGLSASP